MSYSTPAKFIEQFGLEETTDLLRDEEQLVTSDLLKEAMAGEFIDRSQEEIAAAESAIKHLNDALTSASRMMDGYFLAVLSLPLTQQQIDLAPVSECCLELARCHLQDDDDNQSEDSEKRCKRWFSWLRDVADSRVKLVVEQAGTGGPRHGYFRSDEKWSQYPWPRA